MKIVKDAVDRLVENLDSVTDLEEGYRSTEDYNYFGTERTTATVGRLRLDWELSNDTTHDGKSVLKAMSDIVALDLSDLVENGDAYNNSDPLLNVFDGAKKRGKQPVLVDIFGAKLYQEVKERKNSTEYTLYVLMAVQWED